MISVEIWNNEQLWDTVEFDPNADFEEPGTGGERLIEVFTDAIDALVETGDLSETFTLIATKVSESSPVPMS